MSFFANFKINLTEEFKQQEIDIMNRDTIEAFNWTETRRRDFVDTMQKVVLKYYKQLFELDSDGWIMYSVYIAREYSMYIDCFDHIHGFINYEFPEEFINMKYDEYRIKYLEAIENRPDLSHRHIDE